MDQIRRIYKQIKKSSKIDVLEDYLLLNNCISNYSTYFTLKSQAKYEQFVISEEEKLISTLKILDDLNKNSDINFSLYKTYKHIPELVDGDIDVLIKEEDIDIFLKYFDQKGFKITQENTPFGKKYECIKDSYKKVEPRTHITFLDRKTIDYKYVWKEVTTKKIGKISLPVTSLETDITGIYLNAIYGPKYIRLYERLLLYKINKNKLPKIIKNPTILREIIEFINTVENTSVDEFPVFVPFVQYVDNYARIIISNKHFSSFEKAKHILFYFLIWAHYTMTGKLYFQHI